MLRFACLMLVVSCCLADDLNLKDHWGKFKSTFKKQFKNNQQETLKQAQWEEKVKGILKHNVEADLGTHTYKKGVNEFTDMSHQEFSEKMLGLKMPANLTTNFLPAHLQKSERALPSEVDWRKNGYVTSVKNQGSCGSCWTFAVAASMEGAYAKVRGQLMDFSEQQLLDCSGSYGTQGCGGGWPDDAFRYIKDYGIESYNCYPYENTKGQCRYNSGCKKTGIQNYYDVPKNEADLKQHLASYGPISVCVYVNGNMQAYSGGIYTDNTCTGYVNHAVTLVGYGTEGGRDYWIVKNSWGSGWGENGFIRIARNYNNMCQIANYASFGYI